MFCHKTHKKYILPSSTWKMTGLSIFYCFAKLNPKEHERRNFTTQLCIGCKTLYSFQFRVWKLDLRTKPLIKHVLVLFKPTCVHVWLMFVKRVWKNKDKTTNIINYAALIWTANLGRGKQILIDPFNTERQSNASWMACCRDKSAKSNFEPPSVPTLTWHCFLKQGHSSLLPWYYFVPGTNSRVFK